MLTIFSFLSGRLRLNGQILDFLNAALIILGRIALSRAFAYAARNLRL